MKLVSIAEPQLILCKYLKYFGIGKKNFSIFAAHSRTRAATAIRQGGAARCAMRLRKRHQSMTKDTSYNTVMLPNGLRVIHRPSPSQVVYCGYAVNAGTRDELPGEEGMAHFCEHMSFKGTTHRRAWHIMHSLESVGGDLNAFTNKEETVYHAAILRDHIARAVDLLTDIVFHSTYPQAEIDKEVEVICDEIESYNDSPADLIYDEMENTVFLDSPLGHSILGEARQLRTFTTADAVRFTGRLYRPGNAVFFAYGDIDFKRLVALLRRAHAIVPDAPDTACPDRTAIRSLNMRRQDMSEYRRQDVAKDMHTAQQHVMIAGRAYAATDSRRMALCLLNNIIGGPAMTSRLNLSLREHNALVYSVESYMTAYSDTGIWCIYFGCDAKDTPRCMRLVRRELDKAMLRPLSDTQLRAAKKQIKGQIAVACDNREGFAIDFAKTFLHYGTLKDTARMFALIDALTPDDLLRAARDIFDAGTLSTMTIR